jgi:hypothetical protein
MQLVVLPPSFSCVFHHDLSFLLPWALLKMIDEFDNAMVFFVYLTKMAVSRFVLL